MAYYKARNKASSITHAMAWVNLENIIVHEISQTKLTNLVWFHLYKSVQKSKSRQTESSSSSQ